MKKILIVITLVAAAFAGCKKESDPVKGCMDPNSLTFNSEATEDDGSCQYIEKVNRAAYIHFTEDWCGPCGKYGGPTFDSCLKSFEGTQITCMKVYEGSNTASLNNSYATLMENGSNYNLTSIPTMTVNSATSGVYSSLTTNYNFVRTQSNIFASAPVVAGVHLSKSIDGSNMNVTAKMKFFSAVPAGKDYRLAIYVLEDNVIAPQVVSGVSGTVAQYVHRNIWRATNGTDYKGVKINASSAISADQRFDQSATISLLSNWNKSNLKVMAIIWDVPASGKPTVVNSNVVK